jgi:hypothetical protein
MFVKHIAGQLGLSLRKMRSYPEICGVVPGASGRAREAVNSLKVCGCGGCDRTCCRPDHLFESWP